MRNLIKAHDLGRRAALCVLGATIILCMVLNLIVAINPSSRALTNFTDHIGAA